MTAGAETSRAKCYLPADKAMGCPYCFNPLSADLLKALTRPAPLPSAPIQTGALCADFAFFHGLLRKHYAGYADWLHAAGFDIEAFFASWYAELAAAVDTISFTDAIINPLRALRQVVPDHHFTIRGADAVLAKDESL